MQISKLPICLMMFSSTKGHFDKDTYQYTITRLFDKIDFNLFGAKVVHIKYEPGDEAKLEEMKGFFADFGIDVIATMGLWKHYSSSHYTEHARDIATLTHCKQVSSQNYILWIEDDIAIKTEQNLAEQLYYAVSVLSENPELMCVRILDDPGVLPSMKVIEETKDRDIFLHADTFSFRCNLMRSRDARSLGSFFKHHFKVERGIHIEMYATEILRCLSGSPIPFSCFNLDKLSHVHIGRQDFNKNIVY